MPVYGARASGKGKRSQAVADPERAQTAKGGAALAREEGRKS